MSVSELVLNAALFEQHGGSQFQRILGLCDREETSKTYGCCDRNYWHYRLLDLPNARLQEVCWYLTALAQIDSYQNPRIVMWVQAMLDFWLSWQNKDGSVNEVYPYERSFCATSFSTLAVTECLLAQPSLMIQPKSLIKTGRWLSGAHNPSVFNQEAASLVALYNIGNLTGDSTILAEVEIRQRTLLNLQDDSGYFPEYGGMDVGYCSISLGLLALYWQKTQDSDVREACERAVAFLEPLIDGEGRYDNRNTSRKTQYLYPYGLAVFAPHLLQRLQVGLERQRVICPQWLDDRYCIPLATDYLLTAQYLRQAVC